MTHMASGKEYLFALAIVWASIWLSLLTPEVSIVYMSVIQQIINVMIGRYAVLPTWFSHNNGRILLHSISPCVCVCGGGGGKRKV